MLFYGSPCRWNNAQTEHHQEPNFHHYNDDMSTNEDLHHKREQNGDEELTSMLQRYLDNSCSNISGSMGKNKAIETDIIFIDRPSGSYNICEINKQRVLIFAHLKDFLSIH